MESNLVQVVQNEGISAEHGYSKNLEVQAENTKSSAEMSQNSATSEQQGQQSQPKVANVKKTERPSPAKTSHAPLKVGSIDDLSKINPQQLASWLLDEQKKKKALPKQQNSMSKLQQQLQAPSNSAVQQNVVSSSGGAVATVMQKDAAQSTSGNRKGRVIIPGGQSLVNIRPQLQQGLLQQNVVLNTNQTQRFQTVGSPQSTVPNPQRQASPNVRVVGRPPNPNTPILPRGINMSPMPPQTLAAIAPKQQMGKQTIPANCIQGNRLAIPVQSNSQFQPSSETVLVVTQPDGNQGNQLIYTVSKNPSIIIKQPQHVVLSPGNTGRKRILHVKNQPGVIAQPRQFVTIKQPAAMPNGVNIKGNVQAGQGNSEEGQGYEEENEEEQEGDQPMEDTQNCPTLAEEQRLQSMNQLNAGEICRIVIDDGKPFKVLWTGENFVDLSRSPSKTDNVKGGGVKTVEPKNLKGNATGLHMTRSQEGNSTPVSGRNWQYSSEGKELRRPPIRPDSAQGQMQTGTGENDSQTETVRRTPTEPNKFAVCKCCGHISQDYTQCDYCRRPLPPDSKFYSPKGAPDTVKVPGVLVKESEDAKAGIDAGQFYAKTTPRILAKRGRASKTVKRKKTEPEMVTISSDEEDEEGMDAAAAQSLMVAGKGIVVIHQQPAANQAPVIQQQLMQLPLNNTQVVVNPLSRRQRMEDQKGNVVKKPGRKKKKLTPAEQAKVIEQLAGADDEDMLPETVALDARGIRIGSLRGSTYTPAIFSDTGITLSIECTKLSIGELVISAQDLTRVLYHVGVKMPCIFLQTTPECTNRIRLKCGMEHKDVSPYYDPMSPDESQKLICIILVKLNQEEKDKLTCMFEHYDAVTHMRHNLVEHIDYNTANVLLAKSSGAAGAPIKVFTVNSITGFHGVGPILHPANFQGGEESDMDEDEDDEPQDRSRSPSPPLSVFAGPIVKLYTYPPPPATGGITVTNEDLFCLNEGEFLNDVIIDFYLKFLYLNSLEDHEREKTHIFSSFFYRRLTQKAKRATEEGETPQQKRHNRVKTWTRHVDLFKKDFIIVPINESAHWYLAVICFPWMMKPEKLNVITHVVSPPLAPTPESKEDEGKADEQKTEAAAAEDGSKSTEEPETSNKEEKEDNKEQKHEDMETDETEEKTTKETSNDETANSEENKANGEKANDQDAKSPEGDAEKGKTESEENKDASPPSLQESEVPKDAQPVIGAATGIKTVTRQACILVFDSLAGPSRSSVVRTLREYLQVEWDVKKAKTEGPRTFDKDTIKGANPKCPQQTNYSDCGVYLLQYVESFFEDPIQDYVIPMKTLGTWFPEERVRCKREELRELLLQLKQQLNPNLEYDCSKDILS